MKRAIVIASLLIGTYRVASANIGVNQCPSCTQPKLHCGDATVPVTLGQQIRPVQVLGALFANLWDAGIYYNLWVGPDGGGIGAAQGSGPTNQPQQCYWTCEPIPGCNGTPGANICASLGYMSPMLPCTPGTGFCDPDPVGDGPQLSNLPAGLSKQCQQATGPADFEQKCVATGLYGVLESTVRRFGGSSWSGFCNGVAGNPNVPCIDNRICKHASDGDRCIQCNGRTCFRRGPGGSGMGDITTPEPECPVDPPPGSVCEADTPTQSHDRKGNPLPPTPAAPSPPPEPDPAPNPPGEQAQQEALPRPAQVGTSALTPTIDPAHQDPPTPRSEYDRPPGQSSYDNCVANPFGFVCGYSNLPVSGDRPKPGRALRNPGRHAAPTERAGDPVVVASGAYTDHAVDLEIPAGDGGDGLHFKLERWYSSAEITRGVLGRNWMHNYEEALIPITSVFPGVEDLPSYCTSAPPMVRCLAHVVGPGNYQIYTQDPISLVFLPGPGNYSVARQLFDDVTKRHSFILREASGLTSAFDADGRLRAKRDRAGNSINLYYGVDDKGPLQAVADPLQRVIKFEHNPNGTLRKVTDWAGRAVDYDYEVLPARSPLPADLAAQVESPDARLPGFLRDQYRLIAAKLSAPATALAPARQSAWRYSYTTLLDAEAGVGPVPEITPHGDNCATARGRYGEISARELWLDHLLGNLETVTDPLSRVVVVNRYEKNPGSPDFDRVTSQRYGDTAVSQTAPAATYSYLATPPLEVQVTWTAAGGLEAEPDPTAPSGKKSCEQTAIEFYAQPVMPEEHQERETHPTVFVNVFSFFYNTSALAPADLASVGGDLICSGGGEGCRPIGVRQDLLAEAVNRVCAWTRFTDQNGGESWFGLNFAGQALVTARKASPGEAPPYFTTINQYNLHGELASTTSPRGHRFTFAYDEISPSPQSRGNLLRVTEIGAPTGDTALARTWDLQYEPLFNRVISESNFNTGRFTLFGYDYQEQNATAGSQMVAAYLALYGSRLTPAQVASAVPFYGIDLNGDARTDRVHGDLIVEHARTAYTASGVEQNFNRVHVYNEFGQLVQTREPGSRQVDYEYFTAVVPTGSLAATPKLTETYVQNWNGLQQVARFFTGGYLRSVRRRLDQPESELWLGTAAQIQARYFQYDSVGNVVSESNGYGSVLLTAYDGFGQVVQVIDEDGFRQTYDYDDAQELVRSVEGIQVGAIGTSPARRQRRFYNAGGSLVALCGELVAGGCERPLDTLIAEVSTATDFVLTRYLYDLEEQLVHVIDPEGHSHRLQRNTRGLPITMVRGHGTASQIFETYGYDAEGALVSISNAAGEVRLLMRDGFGRVREQREPNGTRSVATFDLDDIQLSETVTDAAGIDLAATSYEPDERGRIRRVRRRWGTTGNPLPQVGFLPELVTSIELDEHGEPTRITDPDGNQTTYQYSSIGSVMKETDALGSPRYTYIDIPRRRIWHRQRGEGRDEMDYVGFDRRGVVARYVASPWLSPDAQDLFQNDGLGNEIWHSNRQGNVTLSTYDLLGRPLTRATPEVEQGPANLVTHYQFDRRGQLTQLDDPMGVRSTRAYFPNGRLAVETVAARTTAYTWDSSGRLETITDPDGGRLAYGYQDDLLRTVTATTPAAGQVGSRLYIRDGLGRAVEAQHTQLGTTISTSRHFDTLGNLLDESTDAGALGGWRVRYGYDRLEHQRTLEYPDGQLASFDTDVHGRTLYTYFGDFTGRTTWEGPRLSFLEAKQGTDTVYTQYAYHDAIGREFERTIAKPGQTPYFYQHRVVDQLDRLRLERRSWSTGGSSGSRTRVAKYSGAGWLASTHEAPGFLDYLRITDNSAADQYVAASMPTPTVSTFSHDQVGTLLAHARAGTTQYQAAKAVTTDHRLGSVTADGVSIPISYDPSGRIETDGRSHFTWNPWGHLVQLDRLSDGRRFEYLHDAFDRRIARVERTSSGAVLHTDTFTNTGWDTIAVVRDGTLATRIIPGPLQDQALLIQPTGAQPTYPYYDPQGNVAGTLIGTATHGERYDYDTYGQAKIYDSAGTLKCDQAVDASCTAEIPFGYTGQPRDPESGLYYYRHRYYSPRLRTFLTPDPAGAADSFDPWSYVAGDPLNYTDPWGLRADRAGIGRTLFGQSLPSGPPIRAEDRVSSATEEPKSIADAFGSFAKRALKRLAIEIADPRPARPKAGKCPRQVWTTGIPCVEREVDVPEDAVDPEDFGRMGVDSMTDAGKGALAGRRAPSGDNARRGPKTDPNAPHNAKIRKVAEQLEAEGKTVVAGGGKYKERLTRTAGGKKEGRRADIIYQEPTGKEAGVNIGRTYKDGKPVKREQDALDDLNGPGQLPTVFIPYDR